MSAYLDNILKSGRQILSDTKATKAVKTTDIPTLAKQSMMVEQNPHKAFIKQTIQNKPTKKDVVEKMRYFIHEAEAQL